MAYSYRKHGPRDSNIWSYYNATCDVCGKVAHYRVGKRGFCRSHRALADALRAAHAVKLNVEAALRDRTFEDADKGRHSKFKHHSAVGKKHKGFK